MRNIIIESRKTSVDLQILSSTTINVDTKNIAETSADMVDRMGVALIIAEKTIELLSNHLRLSKSEKEKLFQCIDDADGCWINALLDKEATNV